MDKAIENIVRSKKKRESSTPTTGRNFETKYLYRKKDILSAFQVIQGKSNSFR